MSDFDLRDLERRFLESAAAEDETAWLVARLRVGELSEGALRLAAGLGHEPAAQALLRRGGLQRLRLPRDKAPSDPLTLRLLRACGWEALARAACCAARVACSGEASALESLQLGEALVLDPSEELRRRVGEALRAWSESLLDGEWLQNPRAASGRSALLETLGSTNLKRMSVRLQDLVYVATQRPAEGEAWHAPPRPFSAVIAEELVPWVLGYSDPLKERVGR